MERQALFLGSQDLMTTMLEADCMKKLRRYNETLQDYNTFLSLFPNNLVASMGGFARNDAYFKTEEGARQAPKVNFNYGTTPAAPSSQPAPAPAKP